MRQKTVSLSVRISDEDAEYIAQRSLAGALTPSDKVRAIIKESRERHLAARDFTNCRAQAREMLAPVQFALRKTERKTGMHSELLRLYIDWLIDGLAELSAADIGKMTKKEALQVEEDVGDQIFRLLEAILRMGLTLDAPCYNRHMIRTKLNNISELVDFVANNLKDGTGEV